MDPNLVCKIVVVKNGTSRRGTGYPIAPDKILTASHVVRGADRIDLFFPGRSAAIPQADSIAVIWDGKDKDGVDVAVLKCELPDRLWPNSLRMECSGLNETVTWEAHGYASKVKDRTNDDIYRFGGLQFPRADDGASVVDVPCISGPDRATTQEPGDEDKTDVRVKDWKGVSGCGVFECAGSHRMLGVVTEYVPDEQKPTLRVVRLPYLFAIPSFAELVSPEAGEQRLANARKALIEALSPLGQDLNVLTEKLRDMNLIAEPHAESAANSILGCGDVPELLMTLCELAYGPLAKHTARLAEVAQVALPVNYARVPVTDLRRRLGTDSFWLLEGTTRTTTLAEIIMAGFDWSPTTIQPADVSGTAQELRSPMGFDISTDPPPTEGPADPNYANVGSMLRHLMSLLGGDPPQAVEKIKPEALAADLEIRQRLEGRTTYCVVTLPVEQTARKQMEALLRETCRRLNAGRKRPVLVFVEKVPEHIACQTEVPGELRVQAAFRQLLLQTHPPKK